MQTIIGLTGRKQSGKTAAASMLAKNGYTRLSFAESIRDMLWVLMHQFGYDFSEIEHFFRHDKDLIIDPIGKTARQLMQTMGTDWGREMINDDIWIHAARHKIAIQGVMDIVIDDVRFDNEAKLIRDLGGLIINIDRQSANTDYDGHRSEAGIILQPGDISLFNDKTLTEFLAAIMLTVNNHRKVNEYA
jgi:hypothetical protein